MTLAMSMLKLLVTGHLEIEVVASLLMGYSSVLSVSRLLSSFDSVVHFVRRSIFCDNFFLFYFAE